MGYGKEREGDGFWTCRRRWVRNWTSSPQVETTEEQTGQGKGLNVPPFGSSCPKERTWSPSDFPKAGSKWPAGKAVFGALRPHFCAPTLLLGLMRAGVLEQGQHSREVMLPEALLGKWHPCPLWGCRGWGWQAAGTWVSVSREMVGFPAPIR